VLLPDWYDDFSVSDERRLCKAALAVGLHGLGSMGLAAWAWQHGLAISTSGPQNATNATYSVVTPRNCRGVAAYHVNCAASYGKMSGQWQHKGKEATRLVHTLIVCIMFNSDRRYFKGW